MTPRYSLRCGLMLIGRGICMGSGGWHVSSRDEAMVASITDVANYHLCSW